jgi:hypothetical protein
MPRIHYGFVAALAWAPAAREAPNGACDGGGRRRRSISAPGAGALYLRSARLESGAYLACETGRRATPATLLRPLARGERVTAVVGLAGRDAAFGLNMVDACAAGLPIAGPKRDLGPRHVPPRITLDGHGDRDVLALLPLAGRRHRLVWTAASASAAAPSAAPDPYRRAYFAACST